MGTSNGSNRMESIANELKAGVPMDEICAKWGVKPSTVKSYRIRYNAKQRPPKADNHAHCACGLRLYGDEEFPGCCYDCGLAGGYRAAGRFRIGEPQPSLSLGGRFRDW